MGELLVNGSIIVYNEGELNINSPHVRVATAYTGLIDKTRVRCLVTTNDSNPLLADRQLALFDANDYNDWRPLPEIIAAKHGFALAFHEDADQSIDSRWYSVQDWIAGVSQTKDPNALWRMMVKRTPELRTPCSKLPYKATNGRTYKMEHAQAITLYEIVQRMDANTLLRDHILRYLAKAGVRLDQERRDPEKALNRAIEGYQRKGFDAERIEARMGGIVKRNVLTRALRASVVNPNYAEGTDHIYIGLCDHTAKALRKALNVPEHANLRDFIGTVGLQYISLAENLIGERLSTETDIQWSAALRIIDEFAAMVGDQAKQASRMLGRDVFTGKPMLEARV